jgi:hypothetical protein
MNKKLNIALFMLISLFAINANGAPMAYSVNSDSGNVQTEDSLFEINLLTGEGENRGELISGVESRLDTEGLAMSPDGTLWGIDDDSMTLFQINQSSGAINFQDEIPLVDLPAGGGNDFGMTFTCQNSLFITSVLTQTLYHQRLDGTSEVIGTEGALGNNISAIAAIGNPVRLFGLGNGQFQNGTTDSPNLYSIDPETGIATLIGALGDDIGEYNQGGLGFDEDGGLWAITDRRVINNTVENLPSQILKLDTFTGKATVMSSTVEVGFESLAVAPPSQCSASVDVGSYPTIPTLNTFGRLLAIFALLLAGTIILRKRISR